MKPITALMPIKNGEYYLNKILPTIVSNMLPTDEIIIVDDNSNDNSIKMVKDFINKNEISNIRVEKNPNEGLVSALNFGISVSTHEWIARFDVDDNYEINRIKNQRRLIEQDCIAIFSDYDMFLHGKKFMGYFPTGLDPRVTAISLVNSQRTAHPSVIFSKEAILNVGGYLKEDFPAEDLSVWLRMAKIGNLVGVPETLLHYNLNPNSTSFKQRRISLEKKSKLINYYGINKKLILSFLQNQDQIFEKFSNYQFSEIREILTINDVLALNKFGYLTKKNLLKEIIYFSRFITNPNYIKAFYQIRQSRNLRQELREIYEKKTS